MKSFKSQRPCGRALLSSAVRHVRWDHRRPEAENCHKERPMSGHIWARVPFHWKTNNLFLVWIIFPKLFKYHIRYHFYTKEDVKGRTVIPWRGLLLDGGKILDSPEQEKYFYEQFQNIPMVSNLWGPEARAWTPPRPSCVRKLPNLSNVTMSHMSHVVTHGAWSQQLQTMQCKVMMAVPKWACIKACCSK